MSYATASTIKTVTCIINHTNAAGSGFGVTPDEEGVFIPSRVMESARLDIGDKLKVFAQDNHADPDTQHYTARWRAIRVVIEERFSERVGEPIDVEHPVPKPIVAPKAVPKANKDAIKPVPAPSVAASVAQ